MPMLRAQRRRRRPRKGQHGYAYMRNRRRNLDEFIPKSDSDFAFTASGFVSHLKREPQTYGVASEQIAEVEPAVKAFRNVLSKLHVARISGGHTPTLTREKNAARKLAVEKVTALADLIRVNRNVPESKKELLRIKVRPKRSRKHRCPQTPPTLQFMGSGDGVVGGIGVGGGSGVHVLKYVDNEEGAVILPSKTVGMMRRARPQGAVRVELFFEMIPVGEPVPRLPGKYSGGWPNYLRSFTRSPMEVQFPVPSEPMLIVYWAKWADSSGEVSRWSTPCVARVEGWTAHKALPASQGNAIEAARVGGVGVQTKYVFIQTPIAGELPASPLDSEQFHGDSMAQQIANVGRRMLEHAAVKMLDGA